MKTLQINLYAFEELEQQAKAKALTDHVYFNLQDDWWRNVYEDAERVFLKLTGFDTDRGAYCNGEWMVSADKSANAIIQEHGESTNTFLLAQQFLKVSERTEEVEDAFLKNLLQAYLKMLVQEYDDLSGDAAIIDAFNGNDQMFTADGCLAGILEKLGTLITSL
jgi:hypothetical protein